MGIDDGFNSSCHGQYWGEGYEEVLKDFNIAIEWVNYKKKKYVGLGGAEVYARGLRRIPLAMKFADGKGMMMSRLSSYEIEGSHDVLLLSQEAQAKMGLIKDYRTESLRSRTGQALLCRCTVTEGLECC